MNPEDLHPEARVFRHQQRQRDFEPAIGDNESVTAVTKHIERHIGPPDTVWHELVSDIVHVDVHLVNPAPTRAWYTLVTSGMSDKAMSPPAGAKDELYAELMLCLPTSWPLTQGAFKDENNYWPIKWLKMLARLPHEYDTWLSHGHTIPNGDPAEPFAPNTKLCCWILLWPGTAPEAFRELSIGERTVRFFALIPLYREEMDYKLRRGVAPLEQRLDKRGVTELLDVSRRNVCRRWWSLF